MAEQNLEQEVAELKTKLAESTKANNDLSTIIEEQNASLKKAEENESDTSDYVKELEVELAGLKAVAAKQDTELKVLSAKAKGSSEVVTAEHGGKVYQILGGAYVEVDGSYEKLTASDIAASEEILANLVKIQSGILKEVK